MLQRYGRAAEAGEVYHEKCGCRYSKTLCECWHNGRKNHRHACSVLYYSLWFVLPERFRMQIRSSDALKSYSSALRGCLCTGSDLGIVVADKARYESTLQPVVGQWRDIGTRFARLTRLVEVPLFVDSKAARLVQAADLVAHAVW
jgi:hypothetical protein